MDKKLYSCGVFIDLQKAFDTVNHSILLRKLNHYGVRGIINDWFASYLVGRQQTTQIGPKNISKKEVVLSGVPQGSVLGPLLFLIYINDISNSSDKLRFYLFADDTYLLCADKNLKSLESAVNAEIFRVYNWLIANKFSLNIKNSNFVIFRRRLIFYLRRQILRTYAWKNYATVEINPNPNHDSQCAYSYHKEIFCVNIRCPMWFWKMESNVDQ